MRRTDSSVPPNTSQARQVLRNDSIMRIGAWHCQRWWRHDKRLFERELARKHRMGNSVGQH